MAETSKTYRLSGTEITVGDLIEFTYQLDNVPRDTVIQLNCGQADRPGYPVEKSISVRT